MKTAFVFPGQGPQAPQMLDSAKGDQRLDLLCDVVGCDVTKADINANEIASGATVLASVIELDRMHALGEACAAAGGYSVGQWTAMHAAGMLSLEATLRAVHRRAMLMNESDATKNGSMLAVIGLATDDVQRVLDEIDDYVIISNYNCLGQLSLAGTKQAIAAAEESLTRLSPRKMVRVPVAGAWHCSLLDEASRQFRDYLDGIDFEKPVVPVVDNVTGAVLPADSNTLRDALAAHVSSPVRWDACVRTLDAERYLEVGYGDMLTKFGFFIDRKRKHLPSAKVS